ncbi:DUF3068 domain-containing protein [Streptomyces sp. E11-3]|uniref:DUF3068 domain-containing protein n=1 Tax=Streptomyces sp. E11-3 TaxID=3110112 RepID=UPI0039817BBD
MRRTASPLSLTLLGLGVFLLVLAPMLSWYVTPRAKVNPIDIDATTIFTGKGSYFDTGEVKTLTGQDLTITRKVRGAVAESEKAGAAIWDVSTSVDHEGTLPAEDPKDSLQWTLERWVTDRKTNRPVHCCKEKPYIEGEAFLKMPFDVKPRSYRLWDSTAGQTVVLEYKGKKKIQGYEGMHFAGKIDKKDAIKTGTRQVPGVLVGSKAGGQVMAEEWYSNHAIELVADQRTGRVIYAQTGPRKTLRAPGASADGEVVLLESEKIAFTTETQETQVKLAKDGTKLLKLVSETLPIGGGGAGLALTVTGGFLVVRGRDRSSTQEPSTM